MFTCFIQYVVDPNKIEEFEEYACTWIGLIEKYGGIHHGYFLPENNCEELPNSTFSFPDVGKAGPKNSGVALFSFPDLKTYEDHKKAVVKDKKCKIITERVGKSKCFLSYERSFLRPIFASNGK